MSATPASVLAKRISQSGTDDKTASSGSSTADHRAVKKPKTATSQPAPHDGWWVEDAAPYIFEYLNISPAGSDGASNNSPTSDPTMSAYLHSLMENMTYAILWSALVLDNKLNGLIDPGALCKDLPLVISKIEQEANSCVSERERIMGQSRDKTQPYFERRAIAERLYQCWEDAKPTDALLCAITVDQLESLSQAHHSSRAAIFQYPDRVITLLIRTLRTPGTGCSQEVREALQKILFVRAIPFWEFRADNQAAISSSTTQFSLFDQVMEALPRMTFTTAELTETELETANGENRLEEVVIALWRDQAMLAGFMKDTGGSNVITGGDWYPDKSAKLKQYCFALFKASGTTYKDYPAFIALLPVLLASIDKEEDGDDAIATNNSAARKRRFLARADQICFIAQFLTSTEVADLLENAARPLTEMKHSSSETYRKACSSIIGKWMLRLLHMLHDELKAGSPMHVLAARADIEELSWGVREGRTELDVLVELTLAITNSDQTFAGGPRPPAIKREYCIVRELFRRLLRENAPEGLLKQSLAAYQCLRSRLFDWTGSHDTEIELTETVIPPRRSLVCFRDDVHHLEFASLLMQYGSSSTCSSQLAIEIARTILVEISNDDRTHLLLLCPSFGYQPSMLDNAQREEVRGQIVLHESEFGTHAEPGYFTSAEDNEMLRFCLRLFARCFQARDLYVPETSDLQFLMESFCRAWSHAILLCNPNMAEPSSRNTTYSHIYSPIAEGFDALLLSDGQLAPIIWLVIGKVTGRECIHGAPSDKYTYGVDCSKDIFTHPTLRARILQAAFQNGDIYAYEAFMAYLRSLHRTPNAEYSTAIRSILNDEAQLSGVWRIAFALVDIHNKLKERKLTCTTYQKQLLAEWWNGFEPEDRLIDLIKFLTSTVYSPGLIMARKKWDNIAKDWSDYEKEYLILDDPKSIIELSTISDDSRVQQMTWHRRLTSQESWPKIVSFLWGFVDPSPATGVPEDKKVPLGRLQEAIIDFLMAAISSSDYSRGGKDILSTVLEVTGGPARLEELFRTRFGLIQSSGKQISASYGKAISAALKLAMDKYQMHALRNQCEGSQLTVANENQGGQSVKLNYSETLEKVKSSMKQLLPSAVPLANRSEWVKYRRREDDGSWTELECLRRQPFNGQYLEMASQKEGKYEVLNLLDSENLGCRGERFRYFEVTVVKLGLRDRKRQELRRKQKDLGFPSKDSDRLFGDTGFAYKGHFGSISVGAAEWGYKEGQHLGLKSEVINIVYQPIDQYAEALTRRQRSAGQYAVGLTSKGYIATRNVELEERLGEVLEGECIGVGVDLDENCIIFTRNSELVDIVGCCKYKTCSDGTSPKDERLPSLEFLQLGVAVEDGAVVHINGGGDPFAFDFPTWRKAKRQELKALGGVYSCPVRTRFLPIGIRSTQAPNAARNHFLVPTHIWSTVVDNGVPKDLCVALRHALERLSIDLAERRLPRSECQVRDLIDPSLCSWHPDFSVFVNRDKMREICTELGIGDSRGLRANSVFDVLSLRTTVQSVAQSIEHLWLPANLSVRENGEVKINSYINNLCRFRYGELYTHLGSLFALSVPLLEHVLGHYVHDLEHGGERDAPAPYSLRNRDLQVVVSVMDYMLEPGEVYESDWSYCGIYQEHIIAIAMYPVPNDVGQASNTDEDILIENILHFRELRNLQQHDAFPYGSRPPISVGSIEAKPGRMIAFTNTAESKLVVRRATNQNARKSSVAQRVIWFYVVHPGQSVLDSRDVMERQHAYQETIKVLDEALNFRTKTETNTTKSVESETSKQKNKTIKPTVAQGTAPAHQYRNFSPETLLRIAEFVHPPGLSLRANLQYRELTFRQRQKFTRALNQDTLDDEW